MDNKIEELIYSKEQLNAITRNINALQFSGTDNIKLLGGIIYILENPTKVNFAKEQVEQVVQQEVPEQTEQEIK